MFQCYRSDLTGILGPSPDNRSIAFLSVPPVKPPCTDNRTLTDLTDAYLASPEWAQLADRTRYVWRLIVEKIRCRWGTTPIALWSDPKQLQAIIAWRNECQSAL